MVKRGDSRDKDQVGIYIGHNYKGKYLNMVMVKLNYNDYYWFTTLVPLKKLYGFVVLCAGIL